MKKTQKYLLGLLLTIFIALAGCYQSSSMASNEIIPFDSDRWEIEAQESRVEDYLGEQSLFLKGGFATVKNSEFTDGIIEYDIAFDEKFGFPGNVWRLQDFDNFERFYMRPHQSGNPDASQYAPFFNDVNSFQLYSGIENYSARLIYPFDEWIHVKLIVSGKNAEVYVDDMDEPALIIAELKRDVEPGKVGVYSEASKSDKFDVAGAHYANFSYTSTSNPPLKGEIKAPEKAPEETVMSWLVSNGFKEQYLDNKYQLFTEEEKEKLNWTKLVADNSGLANLSKVQGIKDGKNTVFARTKIVADIDTIKQLKFGFSERVKVYLNGRLLYGGNDTTRSRDYRFLGTIGLFDELYLPLKAGDNELWMAVSEGPSWEGWGLIAQLENLQGVSLTDE